jgi:AcrR family transcriptional regulator
MSNSSHPDTPVSDSPKAKLIEAVIHEIEAHGISKVTVRGIAVAADMNVASVSYYFGSKNELVAAALDGSIRHMIEDSHTIMGMGTGPDVLATLLNYYLEGSLRFPRLTRAHMDDAFRLDDYSGAFPTLFMPVISALCDWLASQMPHLSSQVVERRVIAALSGVFFPAFFPGIFAGQATFQNEEGRSCYVAHLVFGVLAPLE